MSLFHVSTRLVSSLLSRRTLGLALGALILASPVVAQSKVELLNVSYDPTREFYKDFNSAFSSYWKKKTGQEVTINQSHGGSGKQARSVIDGLEGDVVTLALAYDIDAISEKGKMIPPNWIKRLPQNSAPYTSTIVFLVRKGNPKKIVDWDDLVRPGISVITPNPKTSGGARWNYLAAWAFAERKFKGDETKVKEYMGRLFKNVPVLDSGARGSTNTFVQRQIGDVLLAWENEAYLSVDELGKDKVQIVVPSLSILAEPSVSWVDKVVTKRKTTPVAKAYLEYLYSPVGQDLAGKHYYRPRDPQAAKKYAATFGKVKLITIDQAFGGWSKAQKKHFDDGGTFDQIYKPS